MISGPGRNLLWVGPWLLTSTESSNRERNGDPKLKVGKDLAESLVNPLMRNRHL